MNKYKFSYLNCNGKQTWVSIKAGTQVEAEAKIEKYLPSAMDIEMIEEVLIED